MIPAEQRAVIMALLQAGIRRGVSAKAIAGLFGLATRTLRRWGGGFDIMRQGGLLSHRGRSRPPREPREIPMLEATGIHQVLA